MMNTIKYVTIAKSSANNPRNDTASIAELEDGTLLAVWHKYDGSFGSDFDLCRIYAKTSTDGGMTWERERMLIDVNPEDHNVQAPGLCLLPNGTLILHCLRGHQGGSSSTMEAYVSKDGGETWEFLAHIWERTKGQWLQGGANHINLLSSGRLLLPFHFGTGHQGGQHNEIGCYFSDDDGFTWTRAAGTVDLPMRGAMESSVAEMSGGRLLMSIRSQLGAVFMCASMDGGNTWSLPQTSGLKSPESCTCLRRIPGTDVLLLLWNDSQYEPGKHHFGRRTPLSAAVSTDEGKSWKRVGNIAVGPNEYTNLNCMFTKSGKAIITYMQVEDPAFDALETDPPFKRTGIDLIAAVLDTTIMV
ncbi:glycoside hydrolase [Paenibacillus sp. HWE-109]|uniref:sialidase family protein n=1 Tax=Paenibacillus sp. HWE-109 TaxID=1306526 RepID=UPI001EE0CFDD|nr:sialidase family protein [Paenibacillus sp. HWE-109]UKS27902.1 glycoside hydrolase [Paenibacillus sp. HWE-109]